MKTAKASQGFAFSSFGEIAETWGGRHSSLTADLHIGMKW
jgi:hypothetical protein